MDRFVIAGILCLCCWNTSSLGQQSISINGYIRDESSGETLIGAAVVIPDRAKGTFSNGYGYYSITIKVPSDTTALWVKHFGYEDQKVSINAEKREQTINIYLTPEPTTVEVVEILANSQYEEIHSTEMSVAKINIEDAKKLPAFFGEVDIIKTLQLKPGISTGSEGSSGLFVRGGEADQNLVLLDETVIYNPSHLFGFFSTFNSNAVKDAKLHKGGFPAQYGGRLSSVIDIRLKEGNRRKLSTQGGVGLISSRLTLEGPLKRDKASFMLAGRRTYADLFTQMINQSQEGKEDFNPIPKYFFYDLNTKINYDLNQHNKLFISGYIGRDKFNFLEDRDFNFELGWGNTNLNLRWSHIWSPRWFFNGTLSYTDYHYQLNNQLDIFTFQLGSRISDYSSRADFTFIPNDRHLIKLGSQTTSHRFEVGSLDAGASDNSFSFEAGNKLTAKESGIYFSDDIKISRDVQVNAGLRVSGFKRGEANYFGIEPRLSARWSIGDHASIKTSYAAMTQYLHLVSSSGASLPTDVWYPSNEKVKPQRSHQLTAGYVISLAKGKLLFTHEWYYKWLKNQIDFRDAANLFVNDNLDEEFVFGRGWSYGSEFYLEKAKGRLTGWLSYTLAWSWREFDGTWRTGEFIQEDAINNGEIFPNRNDKRHDISLVMVYDLTSRLNLSLAWEYRTGNAVTLATGRYAVFNPDPLINPNFNIVPIYTDRNSFRMPAYHKLDVGLVYKLNSNKGESELSLSFYNVYNRRNPFFIYFDKILNDQEEIIGYQPKQVSLFPIIPSITYNFKF